MNLKPTRRNLNQQGYFRSAVAHLTAFAVA
jgi:hypothetical protein